MRIPSKGSIPGHISCVFRGQTSPHSSRNPGGFEAAVGGSGHRSGSRSRPEPHREPFPFLLPVPPPSSPAASPPCRDPAARSGPARALARRPWLRQGPPGQGRGGERRERKGREGRCCRCVASAAQGRSCGPALFASPGTS